MRRAAITHIRKYDFDYSRRRFLEKTALGVGGAGILTPLWPEVCRSGDISKAYPEELTNIEVYTRGAIKVGDVIDADNIDLVQDLVDPILFQEVKQDRRKFFIQDTPTDIEVLFPPFFLDATIKNQGQAVFDNVGNIYASDGQPWIGGLPFPDPQTGNEAIANLTLSWGRHDAAMYGIPALVVDVEGDVQYEYDWVWAEQQCTGLVNPDRPAVHLPGHEDKTRFQSIWFTHTQDVKGSAFVNIWKYDQREFPELYGYLPEFQRVRRFPAHQRFEPYMPGMNLYLSDAWAAGDPMLTWGNFKVIGRGPFLGSPSEQWVPQNENWQPTRVGGKKDDTYYYVGKSLIPDALIFEGEPVRYPNCPVSKRRIYLDARMSGVAQSITYERNGQPWKALEGGGGQRKAEGHEVRAADGRLEWSWNWAISHDIVTNKVTRFYQAAVCRGGWESKLDPKEDMIANYMSIQALRRMGT